ncbi:MAG: DedA family protein [Proteobacteria bacterium]|nr:DedA family protein [Pseudomonadota bacterium]
MEAQLLELIHQSPAWAYLGVFFVLLACGLGLPMPEDITLVAGGYTVYLAERNGLTQPMLLPMIAVGLVGVLTGDMILFGVGRWLGPRAARIWPLRWLVPPRRMERVYRFFARYGTWTAFIARFAPGLRSPTFLLAGTAKMSFRRFALADGAAALISAPLWVWLAYHFGAEIDQVKLWLARSRYALFAVAAGLLVLLAVQLVRGRLEARQRDR